MGAGRPVISAETRKKELIGDYNYAGHQWRPAGEPVLVKTHDFLNGRDRARRSLTGSMTSPRTPVGSTVGTDHDTAAFAVASIRRW